MNIKVGYDGNRFGRFLQDRASRVLTPMKPGNDLAQAMQGDCREMDAVETGCRSARRRHAACLSPPPAESRPVDRRRIPRGLRRQWRPSSIEAGRIALTFTVRAHDPGCFRRPSPVFA